MIANNNSVTNWTRSHFIFESSPLLEHCCTKNVDVFSSAAGLWLQS